jgi:hypothetical protein
VTTDTNPRSRRSKRLNNLGRFVQVVDDGAPELESSTKPPEADCPRNGSPDASAAPWDRVIGAAGEVGKGAQKAAGDLGKGAQEIWSRFGGEGVDAKPISRSQAALLEFPLDHPHNRVLYVRHPVKPRSYLPAAWFRRRVFEHKFFEAVRLLMAMGAKELDVRLVYGWGKEFAAGLDVPSGVRPEAKGKSKEETRLLFTGKLAGAEIPYLPPDLLWYHSEPSWMAIAEGRVRFGLKQFSMYICYEDDFGVNASLKAAAGKVGLGLGGNFVDHQSTVWRIDATF